jgi:hypothetical protein
MSITSNRRCVAQPFVGHFFSRSDREGQISAGVWAVRLDVNDGLGRGLMPYCGFGTGRISG